MMGPRSTRPHRARALRGNLTDAEKRLWRALRLHQLEGGRFRRQVPLGRYIVDFACIDHRLVIEVDGGQHGISISYDEKRTAWLQQHGWRVLRFWNNEVVKNLDGVLAAVRRELSPSSSFPHPGLPPQAGEGEGGA